MLDVTFARAGATIGLIVILFALDLVRLAAGHLQSSTSLVVIVPVLAITSWRPLLKARRGPEARAHAATLRDTRLDEK